ncbi:hypothetical protein Tco_1256626, partial [Tanacetum coccineum]
VVNNKLNWTNPEGHGYPFHLRKPLPLIEDQGRQVVLANYFINNDLEYLKGGSLSRKYTTSTTKTKAAKYDTIEGIEDMVSSLWSPVKVAYDKYAMCGISHWGPKRQSFYGYASNKKSSHDVFSTKRIIAVTHVKVMKKYDYGYLEEIIVQREDQQLHKFMEGDFPRLNLRGIKDMILLSVTSHSHLFEGFFMILLPAWRWITCKKKRWSKINKKRSRIMIKAIDQQLFERRLMRNLEKFVGGREYGTDLKLLERTI